MNLEGYLITKEKKAIKVAKETSSSSGQQQKKKELVSKACMLEEW